MIQLRNPRLFDMAIYVTLAMMAVIIASVFPGVLLRGASVALCIAFGLVYRLGYYAIRTPRQATLYLTTQSLILLTLHVLAPASDLFGLLSFILGIQAVLVMPNRMAIMWIMLLYLIDSGGALWVRGVEGIIPALFNIAVFILIYVFAYIVRQAEIARLHNEQLLADLRLAQRQLHDLAVAEERNRLARDLHDSVKQQVFAATMQLGAARVLLQHDPQPAHAHVVEAEQLAQQAGAELSLLIHELRPVALGDNGLAEALHAYSTDWSRQTGIAAAVQAQGERRLPPATEHALLRVTQEALANVARHSQATVVAIELAYTAAAVTLRIADNGYGFDVGTTRKGVGLDSMRERIEGLGGRVLVESQIGVGTTIFVQCGGPNA
jgi:signal transduction histidine kinase